MALSVIVSLLSAPWNNLTLNVNCNRTHAFLFSNDLELRVYRELMHWTTTGMSTSAVLCRCEQKIGESEMQISLAKPPTENKQKEKRKQMHKMQFMHGGLVRLCIQWTWGWGVSQALYSVRGSVRFCIQWGSVRLCIPVFSGGGG